MIAVDDFKKLGRKILVFILIWLLLIVVSVIIMVVLIFTLEGQTGSFVASYQTFTVDNVIVLKASIFQNFENSLLENVNRILYDLRHNVLFSQEFRIIAVVIATLGVLLMGITMLTGQQEITVKEFASDLIIIFGTTGLLLSPLVEYYIDFFYGIITALSDFMGKLFISGVFKSMAITYQDGTPAGNLYAPLDVVASMFFESEIANRVRLKMAALLFAGYIHYVPIIAICMLYALLLTLYVFIMFMIAKMTIIFALQCLPFFILYASINNVKIKFTKSGSQSKKYLWLLIDVGIIKPWVYLTLMSFMAALLFYALILSNIENMFAFPVSLERMNFFGSIIPLFGSLVDDILDLKRPLAHGIDYAYISEKLALLIAGVVIFKKAFMTLSELVGNLSFATGETALTGYLMKDGTNKGNGIFSSQNPIGGIINPIKDFAIQNTLQHTMGYTPESSDGKSGNKFDKQHHSLLGLIRGKTFYQKEKSINKIKNDDNFTQEEKLQKIIKELKDSSGHKSDIKESLGAKELKDEHFEKYAKELIGDKEKPEGEDKDKAEGEKIKTPEESIADRISKMTDDINKSLEKSSAEVRLRAQQEEAQSKQQNDMLKKQQEEARRKKLLEEAELLNNPNKGKF